MQPYAPFPWRLRHWGLPLIVHREVQEAVPWEMADALFLKNSKGITNKIPQLWSPPTEKWEKRSLFWPYCGDETTIAYDRASEYSFSFPKKRLLSVLNMFIFIELCPQERTGKRSVVPWLMQGKASCSQENPLGYGAKGNFSLFWGMLRFIL